MPILSNQGRTIPELPALTSANIGNNDFLIIQNLSSNSTKRTTVNQFAVKEASLITGFDRLNFIGPNNHFTGSIRNFESDVYSVISVGVPNILKRLILTDYISIGKNPGVNTQLNVYANTVQFDQSGGGNTTFIGNNTNSEIIILNYPNGINISNAPILADKITSTQFIGSLTGDVTGNITSTTGTSYLWNLVVDNSFTSYGGSLFSPNIDGGTIDDCIIGNTTPETIKGTTITATTGFAGNLTGNVTGNVTGDVVGNLIGDVSGNVSGNLSGNVNGNVTGTLYGNVDIYSGTSNIFNLNVNNAFTAASAQLSSVNIAGGTIQNCTIGSTIANTVRGTTITATNKFIGNLTGNVTGDITGNVNASIVYANTFVGGEFNGSLVTATSLNGNLNGDITGNVKTPTAELVIDTGPDEAKLSRFFGTASFSLRALSSSYALKATTVDGEVDYAINALTAETANTSLTSSHLLQFNNRSNTIPYFNGTYLTSLSDLTYKGYLGDTVKYLSFSGSNYLNAFLVDSKASSPTLGQSLSILSVNQNRSKRTPGQVHGPESWISKINVSGSYFFQSLVNSFNFNNNVYQNYAISSQQNLANAFRVYQNNIYYWSDQWSWSSLGRDCGMGLGVQVTTDSVTTTSPLQSKFQIDVFSASLDSLGKGNWTGTATTRYFDTAFLIRHGSGSTGSPLKNTFSISSKGTVYSAGNANFDGYTTGSFRGRTGWTINGKSVSFFGTGSNSVSSSFSVKSNDSINSVTSSNVNLLPFILYNHTTYGVSQNSQGSTPPSSQPYFVPQGSTESSDPQRLKALVIPTGKQIRWFKICGTIKAATTTPYAIYGVSVNDNGVLSDTSTFCNWGWGNSFTTNAGGILPFTIEGSLNGNFGGSVIFKVWATPGIEDFQAYVVVYYDN